MKVSLGRGGFLENEMVNEMFFAARVGFGFENPNLAGALFAMLAIGTWGVVHAFARWVGWRPWFWAALLLSGAFAAVLVMTASRGALVALVVGGIAMWGAWGFIRPKPWQAAAVLAGGVMLGVFSGFGRMGERVVESSAQEGSITSRVEIFKAVPAMLVVAPCGWGRGQSAEGYQNWFQELDDMRTYKHLISTHATWMVEWGWGFRIGYVLGWVVVLVLCAYSPACFGVWMAFGVAGLFSHVGGDWRLVVAPVVALGFALKNRFADREWPGFRAWLGVGVAAAVGMLFLGVVGAITRPELQKGEDRILWGAGRPKMWFYAPSPVVLGKTYGKSLRRFGSVGVTSMAESVDRKQPVRIVLSGSSQIKAGEHFSEPYALIWLNPPGRLDAEQKRVLEKASEKIIVWGEFRSNANPTLLKAEIMGLPKARWVTVFGGGMFLDGNQLKNLMKSLSNDSWLK